MNPALHYVDSYGAFMEWRTKEMSRREFEYGDPAGYRGMQQRKRERKKRRPGSRRMRQKRRKRILKAANTIDKVAVFEASRFVISYTGSWHPEVACSQSRRHATRLSSVAIAAPTFGTLVAATPQRLFDFLFKNDFDHIKDPLV